MQDQQQQVDGEIREPFDAQAERAYRRGYVEGFLAGLDLTGEGIDREKLYRFRAFVLEPWAEGDCDKPMLPPRLSAYRETTQGWVKRRLDVLPRLKRVGF